MAVTRSDIKRRLDQIVDPTAPLYADDIVVEAFKREAVVVFCSHFDENGWPTDMPKFMMLLPSRTRTDVFAQDGYAGYEFKGKSAMWRMPFGTTKFEQQ